MRRRLLVARNVLKALLLLTGFCAALGAVGWLLAGYRGLTILAFSGLLLGVGIYAYVERIPFGMLGARELPLGEAPQLHAMLELLARRAQVPKPRLYLLEDGHPRTLANGRGPGAAGIGVTSGALAACPPAELEGLLAHELAHVAVRDVLVQSTAAVVAISLLELTRVAGFLQRAALYAVGPIAAGVVHALLSEKREYEADALAARLCGSPHGLADALVRLEQASELIWFEGSPAAEPLYVFNPFAEEGLAAMFVTHPPVSERVRRLRSLAAAETDGQRAA